MDLTLGTLESVFGFELTRRERRQTSGGAPFQTLEGVLFGGLITSSSLFYLDESGNGLSAAYSVPTAGADAWRELIDYSFDTFEVGAEEGGGNALNLAARRAEFAHLSVAVTALMIENGLTSIPNPVSANTAPCTTGTQDMTAYPDAVSTVATADKLNDPNGNAYTDGIDPAGDKDGFLLFNHDLTGNNSQSDLVSYINFDNTTYCYTVDANGTVHQYLGDGTEQVV